MPRSDLDQHFANIESLIGEINTLVPPANYQAVQFRSDLAGMLVVAIAATYETCVKEILFDFANKHHLVFGDFARRNYEKLNSRVQVGDLRRYCGLFDPAVEARFKTRFSERKRKILQKTGKNIETSYEQILSWRHDFAHAHIRNTTIEEASSTFRISKRVLYVFDDAFNRP